MNEKEIHFYHPLLKYEKPATYVWVTLGGLLLFSGIFVDFSWLNDLGYKHLHYYLPIYLRYVSFIKPLFIMTGGFLFFAFILKTPILKFYQEEMFKPEVLLVVFILLIFIALVFIAYVPFKNYPYSMDEYNFLYQAKIFANGKLFLKVPETYRPFVEQYMILRDGKLFSKYPPGFPLILSIGVLLKYPGLINPLISVATLFILFGFVKSLLGPKYGLVSVILMSTTPYFLAYSASYYTHPTALMLTTLLFFGVRKYEITKKDLYLPVIGFVAGYSFLTRPLDSFCAVVPAYAYLAYVMYKEKSLKKIIYPISTFAILFSVFVAYNHLLTKKVSIAAYPVLRGEFQIVDIYKKNILSNIASVISNYMSNGIENLPILLIKYLFVPCVFFIPLFAIFGAFKFISKWKWLLISNYVMLILLYNFHPGLGWPTYGARYYYSGFVSLVVLATVASKQLIEMLKNNKLVYHIFAVILCVQLIFSASSIWAYSYRFKIWTDVRKDLVNTCPVGSIVILNNPTALKPSNSIPLRIADFVDLVDAQRNPFMDPSRLIAIKDKHLKIPRLNLSEIKAHFPNHSICYYNFNILRNK